MWDCYIAHQNEDGRVQSVKEHLENTSALAGKFASAFSAESMGQYAGMLHDIGKYSDDFQRRIRGSNIRADHSTAGAQLALQEGFAPAAFCIAGHHSGIPNGGSRTDPADAPTMVGRSKKHIKDCSAWKREIKPPQTCFPAYFTGDFDSFSQSFFTRMLYSCLVDADYLDTETFMRGTQPRGEYDSIPVLLSRLQKKTEPWLGSSEVCELNSARNGVLRSCIEKGKKLPRGLYTLTVPTGGGKTIASLAFALEHAAALGMDRVIYVIPYTSIIDQTTSVYSKVLGEDNVLAHYAEADFQMSDTEDLSPQDYRRMLAAENWDAPVIVTTAVQFFESLYSNKSSKCRKIHNIANSVIIFDEAQTLPVSCLRPCVAAISQLVKYYRSSVVLCTATQPSLGRLLDEQGIIGEEIFDASEIKLSFPRRTSFRDLGVISKTALTAHLCGHEQVLCIVNTRRRAQELYSELEKDGSFCLTTLVCPLDRKIKLEEIRRRLKRGEVCRVISTSLIEAGVDVDFPAVFREEAGLDSLLQAAGRCNREGNEKDPGKRPVYMFTLEEAKAPASLHQQISAFRAVQRDGRELDDARSVEKYFDILFYKLKGKEDLDKKGVLDAFYRSKNGVRFPFATVAEEFKLIESDMRTIFIPIGDGEMLCRQLRNGVRTRGLFRKSGNFSVSVYDNEFRNLYEAGALELIDDYNAVLINTDQYDPDIGLKTNLSGGQALFIDF